MIVGNPPYNAAQLNENDNNRNRKYPEIENRIRRTYAKDSKATLKAQVYDPYVKFFRWATDRLGTRDGVICLVSNNSFVDQIAFDGMRKHLMQDFTRVFHLHLEGNVRENPKLSGTAYNVFGIQVGVGITLAIRCVSHGDRKLLFHRIDKLLRKELKLRWLSDAKSVGGVSWQSLTPNAKNHWLVAEFAGEFEQFVAIGDKAAKTDSDKNPHTLFKTYCRGVITCRDEAVYDFKAQALAKKMESLVECYNAEVDRFKRAGMPADVDRFVKTDDIKWDGTLKDHLKACIHAKFATDRIRDSLFRPFSARKLYHDTFFLNRIYLTQRFLPTAKQEAENRLIVVSDLGYRAKAPSVLCTNFVPDLHLCATSDSHQCFPFYVYDEDGSNRRENITDWALKQFREQYETADTSRKRERRTSATGKDDAKGDATESVAHASGSLKRSHPPIAKWDIFHYVYGLLHHPGYRTKYADNLKRELPRIPFAPDFWAFADAGKRLAELHLNYEEHEPFELKYVETPGVPLDYRVEKMKFSADKTSLKVNESLTLAGIPPEVFEYRLGNRSALDWVIDQYRVTEDSRSGIVSDPNREDDEEYIVKLVGRVVAVSVETVQIVKSLPADFGG